MQWSALQRARRFGDSPGLWRFHVIISVLSALIVPMLILALGLVVQLIVSRDSGEVPHDWILGPWVSGKIFDWPLFDTYELSVITLIGVGCALALVEAATFIFLHRTIQKYSLHVAAKLRQAIHDQAFRLGSHEQLGLSRSPPAELFVSKTEQVRLGLMQWWRAIPRCVVAATVLLAMALAVNPWLTLLAILLTVYILRTYRSLRKRSAEQSKTWREQAERKRADLLDMLRLAPLTTGYSLDAPPGKHFEEGLEQSHSADLRANMSEAVVNPIIALVVMLSGGFLLLIVGLSAQVTIAGTVLMGTALVCCYFSAIRLYRLRPELEEAEAAASDIFTFLDREPGVGQMADARPLERLKQEVRLDQVTLADRHGKRLLDHVTFSVPAVGRAAVLASDPGTPLALAGLLVRFYDPAAGRVLYDNHDIRRGTLDTVRGQALFVASDGMLFPGSIAENMACGDSGFTTLQINKAAERARAACFIQNLPDGLSTMVGTPESSLRPDEAFRIGLARALLREPSLLIVEEPEVDSNSIAGNELDAALEEAANSASVIVIPSRLHTLRSASHIYLLHEGKLNGAGTHADLLQSSELYRHMIYVRFNAFRDKVQW